MSLSTRDYYPGPLQYTADVVAITPLLQEYILLPKMILCLCSPVSGNGPYVELIPCPRSPIDTV
jgi:hypothetical protein